MHDLSEIAPHAVALIKLPTRETKQTTGTIYTTLNYVEHIFQTRITHN